MWLFHTRKMNKVINSFNRLIHSFLDLGLILTSDPMNFHV